MKESRNELQERSQNEACKASAADITNLDTAVLAIRDAGSAVFINAAVGVTLQIEVAEDRSPAAVPVEAL